MMVNIVSVSIVTSVLPVHLPLPPEFVPPVAIPAAQEVAVSQHHGGQGGGQGGQGALGRAGSNGTEIPLRILLGRIQQNSGMKLQNLGKSTLRKLSNGASD